MHRIDQGLFFHLSSNICIIQDGRSIYILAYFLWLFTCLLNVPLLGFSAPINFEMFKSAVFEIFLCYYSLTGLHSSMSLFAYHYAFILILVDGIITVFLNDVYDFLLSL
jgi:hypothetical protein